MCYISIPQYEVDASFKLSHHTLDGAPASSHQLDVSPDQWMRFPTATNIYLSSETLISQTSYSVLQLLNFIGLQSLSGRTIRGLVKAVAPSVLLVSPD